MKFLLNDFIELWYFFKIEQKSLEMSVISFTCYLFVEFQLKSKKQTFEITTHSELKRKNEKVISI